MKIAFFSNSYLPYLSGITLSIKTLREELLALGHEVLVVGPNYPKHIESDPSILRLSSLPATYPGYRFVLPYSYQIFSRLKREKVDIIHAHQPFGVGLSALLLARRMQVPFVYSFHTLFSRYVHHAPFIPQKLAKAVVARYLSFFCNQADTVIVPSEMVRRLLVLRKIRKPLKVVPTGIDLKRLEPLPDVGRLKAEIRKKHGVPEGAKLLLYSGRISREKKIPFLLKAFPSIRSKADNTYLLIVGGGPKDEEYGRLAKNIDNQIIFVGQVPHSEIFDYYLAADLFVYASITETQGLVLCEAKACGLPVVALFGGGISDVVESGIDGYLVPRNQEKFVGHVVRLLQDDALRRKMGGKAKEDLRLRFSSSVVAKKIESIYNSLIDN